MGTSQPHAFAFDVHAQTHAANLWSPGFLSEEKRGEKSKRAAKEATQDPRRKVHAESQDKPSRGKAFR